MYLYKKCIDIEKKFKELGIDLNPEAGLLNLLDELISWIPDLIITNRDDFCELHKDKVTLIRFKYNESNAEIINKLNEILNESKKEKN